MARMLVVFAWVGSAVVGMTEMGVYIRVMRADIGERLGSGGHRRGVGWGIATVILILMVHLNRVSAGDD